MTDLRSRPFEEDFEHLLASALQTRWPARRAGEARLAQVLSAARSSGQSRLPAGRRVSPAIRTIGFAAGLAVVVIIVTWLFAADSPQPAGESVPLIVNLGAPGVLLAGGQRLEPGGAEWDGYGEAVDIRSDLLVIGASEWNQLGVGSAYVYRLIAGTWELEEQLRASDHDRQTHTDATAYRFGDAVALGENLIAVGAPGVDDPVLGEDSGAVYIFERQGSGWVETAKLAPDMPAETPAPVALPKSSFGFGRLRPRAFGAVLALEGDLLAVGGDPDGRILVFRRTAGGWARTGQFHLPTMPDHDFYLADMSLYGGALALSVFYASPGPEFSSVRKGQVAVYVYDGSEAGWTETLRFRPEADAELLFFEGARIGASVALGGEDGRAGLLAVGLPGFPDWSAVEDHLGLFGPNTETPPGFSNSPRQVGQVYLFDRTESGWMQKASLTPEGSIPAPGPGEMDFYNHEAVYPGALLSEQPEVSFFGADVDVDGKQLAVTSGFSNGTYIFTQASAGWQLAFSLQPTKEDGGVWEDYANVVAVSGLNLLLGTPGEFGNSAYVFRLCGPEDPDCR